MQRTKTRTPEANLWTFLSTHLGESGTEAVEDLLHVSSFLHGDHTQMILLIHPHQEGLVVVVPSPTNEKGPS